MSTTRQDDIKEVFEGPSRVVILGAGASTASTKHSPEPSGKQLPAMNNFVEIVGLSDIIDSVALDVKEQNFEVL